MALVLDLCHYFIWILAGLQHLQHICIGVHELYVYQSFTDLLNIKYERKKFSHVYNLQLHTNIKTTEVNFVYHRKMPGNGKSSNDQVILPFRPLSLVFDHINYFVDMPKVIS